MRFFGEVFSRFFADNCPMLAAALAYYTVFALPPLLYLLMTIVTFGLSGWYDSAQAAEEAQVILEEQASQMLGNQAASQEIATILQEHRTSGGKWWKTLLSVAGILFGATGVVVALQTSLNHVWEVQLAPERSMIRYLVVKRLLSFAMIFGLGFLLLVSMILSVVLAAIGQQMETLLGIQKMSAEIINYGVQALVTVVVFAIIFKYMPDVKIAWRDVLVGALVTTALFLLGRLGMQIYFAIGAPGQRLGSAAASLAVILVWVYYSAMILLLGAEVTHVYATRFGKGLEPHKRAVRVVRTIGGSDLET